MPAIGLIDDKKGQRESTQRIISNYLSHKYEGWECVSTYPFQDRDDYVGWVGENDICVLIVDEQLTGEKSDQGWNVDYDGHNLIVFLREPFPTFPVYAMTAYGAKTEDLLDKYHLFEDILEDRDFYEKPEQNIDRFVRSGQRFTETNRKELEMVSRVAQALAEGKEVDKSVLKHVRAIQERLGLPFTIDSITNRSEAVEELEKQLNEFETVVAEIKNFLEE